MSPAGLETPCVDEIVQRYFADGVAILRRFLADDVIRNVQADVDALICERADFIDPLNLRCRYMPHYKTGEPLFEVFDPVVDISSACRRLSADERLHSVLEAINGEPACLFKDKLIIKPPGATGYGLHQDIPRYWPGFPKSFLTVLIAIDPCTEENGCTEVFAGYHGSFLQTEDESSYMLPDDCVSDDCRIKCLLEPGDVAIFHGLTPHRSEPNRSSGFRRALYLSYNAQSDGGDQRHAHYESFQKRMRERRDPEPVYFQ